MSDNPATILFVDDEDKIRKMFQQLLSATYNILSAKDVSEAKQLLAQHHETIHILVTDQRMPGESGIDLLRYVREEHPAIIRILTTAYSDLDDAIEAVNSGEIFRYITKPWDVNMLLVDMRLAASFFELEQDKSQLIAEKVSLSHRQSIVETIRHLIAISGADKQAVQSLLRQLQTAHASIQQSYDNDGSFWQDEINKTNKLSAISRGLEQYKNAAGKVDNGGNRLLDYQACIGNNIQLKLGNNLSPSSLKQTTLKALLDTVFQAFDSDDISLSVEQNDAQLRLSVDGKNPNTYLITQFVGTDNKPSTLIGQLLGAFISIYNLGGEINLGFSNANLSGIKITLPKTRTITKNPADDTWIEDLFVLYG